MWPLLAGAGAVLSGVGGIMGASGANSANRRAAEANANQQALINQYAQGMMQWGQNPYEMMARGMFGGMAGGGFQQPFQMPGMGGPMYNPMSQIPQGQGNMLGPPPMSQGGYAPSPVGPQGSTFGFPMNFGGGGGDPMSGYQVGIGRQTPMQGGMSPQLSALGNFGGGGAAPMDMSMWQTGGGGMQGPPPGYANATIASATNKNKKDAQRKNIAEDPTGWLKKGFWNEVKQDSIANAQMDIDKITRKTQGKESSKFSAMGPGFFAAHNKMIDAREAKKGNPAYMSASNSGSGGGQGGGQGGAGGGMPSFAQASGMAIPQIGTALAGDPRTVMPGDVDVDGLQNSGYNTGQDALMQALNRSPEAQRTGAIDSNLNNLFTTGAPAQMDPVWGAIQKQQGNQMQEAINRVLATSGTVGQRFGSGMFSQVGDIAAKMLDNQNAQTAQLGLSAYENAQGRRMSALGLGNDRDMGFGNLGLGAQQNQFTGANMLQQGGLGLGGLQLGAMQGNQQANLQGQLANQGAFQQNALANMNALNQTGQFNAGTMMQGMGMNQQAAQLYNQNLMQLLGFGAGQYGGQQNANQNLLALMAGMPGQQPYANQMPGAMGDIGNMMMMFGLMNQGQQKPQQGQGGTR